MTTTQKTAYVILPFVIVASVLTSCGRYKFGKSYTRSEIFTDESTEQTTYTVNGEATTDGGGAPQVTNDSQTATENNDDIGNQNSSSDKKVIHFVAAGDNIIHESVFVDARNQAATMVAAGTFNGSYYFDDMYSGIADVIKSADIAYINQEGPVAGDSLGVYGYPTFNAPEAIGDELISIGFDIVNIANNHMLDMDNASRAGYAHTIEYWKSKPVFTVGGYENETDYNTVRIYEEQGVKLAVLSYTYGTNGNSLSALSPDLVIPVIDDAVIQNQIAAAKSQADVVIVSMHWGTDTAGSSFNNYATTEQQRLAQLIADCGADVIIGMHPHVLQPMCWLTGSSGNRTLVTYSIGNFLSTMLHSYNMVGGLFSFDIVAENGSISIENPLITPIICHYEADSSVLDSQGLPTRYGIKLYLLDNYTEELASVHGAQMYGAFSLDDLNRYVTDTISAEFLR